MKSTITVALLSTAALAASKTIISAIDDFSPCILPCWTLGATADGCAATDLKCLCGPKEEAWSFIRKGPAYDCMKSSQDCQYYISFGSDYDQMCAAFKTASSDDITAAEKRLADRIANPNSPAVATSPSSGDAATSSPTAGGPSGKSSAGVATTASLSLAGIAATVALVF